MISVSVRIPIFLHFFLKSLIVHGLCPASTKGLVILKVTLIFLLGVVPSLLLLNFRSKGIVIVFCCKMVHEVLDIISSAAIFLKIFEVFSMYWRDLFSGRLAGVL